MEPKLKILSLCQWGLVRSVAVRRILIDELGADVIAAGIEKNDEETLKMLGDWADVIFIAAKNLAFSPNASVFDRNKIKLLNIGDDVWQNPRHKDLERKCKDELAEFVLHHRS